MNDKVVVVVRTKNRPVLLARALASVSAQTWTDLSAVVVNDGGEPGPVDEAVRASGLGERAVVVHHPESLGRSAALNAGLDAVPSTAFAVHDDDDTWDPDFLAATVAWLAANPEAVAVATRTEVVYEEVRGRDVVEVGREVLAAQLEQITLTQTAWQNSVPPISMLVRTAVLTRIGQFATDLPVLEDWEFNLRLLSDGEMGFLADRPLAFWHHRRAGAIGDDGNSVIAEARDHVAYDRKIRDDYLRRDLAGEGHGLGLHLATARLLRDMSEDADARWANHSDVVDRWNRGHQEHLSAVAETLGLEIGRLRGEALALRETVVRLEKGLAATQAELRKQIRDDAKPVRQGLRRMSRRVDDLWQTDRGVARLAKQRRRGSS